MSSPTRRRWLTALGLFLASAIGGVVAYLLARRARRRTKQRAGDPSVSELSARLQREAAAQEMRARGGRRRTYWPWRRRWLRPGQPGAPPEGGPTD